MQDEYEKVTEGEVISAVIDAGRQPEPMMIQETEETEAEPDEQQVILEALSKAESLADKEKVLQKYGLANRTGRVVDQPLRVSNVEKGINIRDLPVSNTEKFESEKSKEARLASDARHEATMKRIVENSTGSNRTVKIG